MIKKSILIVLLLVLVGCSQSLYMQGRHLSDEGEYDRAIEVLYDAIKVNPQSADAWRELGVAFYKKGDLDKAEEALKQASRIKPDARTSLYIGLTYEKQDAYDQAIEAYRAALALKPRGKTNDMVRAHLDYLISRKMKSEISLALANENEINVDTIPENTIAVVDFDDQHLPAEMGLISKGLAEFTANDLAKVSTLNVIERLKIEQILNELQLSSSQYADPKTAPRVGKLLGSRNIVTGTVVGIGKEAIQINGAVINTTDSTAELTEPTEGDLRRIFQVQKAFVFQVLDSLGVSLTREERDAIAEVPTESQLAFMAYCRGLNYRSQGMLQEAYQEFNNAAAADGNFIEADFQAKALTYVESPDFAVGASSEGFEAAAISTSDQEMLVGKLDQVLGTALNSTGFLHDTEFINRLRSRTDVPPETGDVDVRVTVRGVLDAQ